MSGPPVVETVTEREYERRTMSDDPIDRSDLPLLERVWLIVGSPLPPHYKLLEMRKRVDEGRFESVEEYFRTKRRLR